jgi:vitamin B12 transporter
MRYGEVEPEVVRMQSHLLLGAAWMCVSTAVASGDMQSERVSKLESIVVSASYSPRALASTTVAVSVLDENLLRRLDKSGLGEALRTLPGVLLEEQGGDGGLMALSLRGGEANFTQVLLDGVPLNDPGNARGGSYDLNLLNGIELGRVEVVRGPQSVIHGSDALAGVVQLITPVPGGARRPKLQVTGGESGYRDYRFGAGVDLDTLGLAVELGRRQSGELVSGSERDTDMAAVRALLHLGESQNVSLQLRALDGERSSYPEQSGGPLFAQSSALEEGEYRSQLAALTWEARVFEEWHSRLLASHLQHQEGVDSPGILPYASVPSNGSETDFQRDQLSWVNTFQIGQAHQASLGGDFRAERGDSQGYVDFGTPVPTDYRLSRRTIGAFAEWRYQIFDPLLLQTSVRSDDPQGFASRTTSRFGLRYEPLPSLALKLNWGEGFKLPSFFALGHALVGNPDLQPETGRGADFGIEWRLLRTMTITATGFFNRYRNLIDFDPEAFTNVNRREVVTRGGEGQLYWQPLPTLTVQGQLTYTDIDVVGENRVLLGRPAWKGGVWMDWEFQPNWRLGLDHQWTGGIPSASLHTGATVTSKLEAYSRVDWRLAWQTSERLQLSLAVDNLLDESYQTSIGFPGSGRTLRMSATLQLSQ